MIVLFRETLGLCMKHGCLPVTILGIQINAPFLQVVEHEKRSVFSSDVGRVLVPLVRRGHVNTPRVQGPEHLEPERGKLLSLSLSFSQYCSPVYS